MQNLELKLNSIKLGLEARREADSCGIASEDIIYRRYHRGLTNLFNSYLPLCDNWFIYDNSQFPISLIAKSTLTTNLIINNPKKWQEIKGGNDESR